MTRPEWTPASRPLWVGCLRRLRGEPLPDDPRDTEDLMCLYRAYRALDAVEHVAVPLRPRVLEWFSSLLHVPTSPDGSSTLVASPEWPDTVLVAGVRLVRGAVERVIHQAGAQWADTESGLLPLPPPPPDPVAVPPWTLVLDALSRVSESKNTEEARGDRGVASAFRHPNDMRRTLTDLHRARLASLDLCACITLHDRDAIRLLFDALGTPSDSRSTALVNREEGAAHVEVGGKPYLQAEVLRAVDRAAALAVQCGAHEPRCWASDGSWRGREATP